jgi:hypothetical protein
MDDCFPEEWAVLRQWLPENLEEMARETGFMQRARGVQDAAVWLRMILLHAGGGLSLEQAVLRASELGLAQVSAVALHKRLLRAGPWLQKLTGALLARRPVPREQEAWRKEVVLVDATSVHEPGSTGTDWRVHYRVRLSDLQCEDYELTDASEGERLGRHAFRRGQIVMADRGYCHRAGAAHVVDSQADLVLRLHPVVFPLEDDAGAPLDLLGWCRRATRVRPIERVVWFQHGRRRYPLRLCAIRKSQTATDRARKKQRTKASRMGTQPDPRSVALAEYVLVVTSLPSEAWPGARVLQLYRYRWQVELVFKRLKSLLGLGHLPKTNDDSARAWMQAKILTALLIERAMYEARFFSPWGHAIKSEYLGAVP